MPIMSESSATLSVPPFLGPPLLVEGAPLDDDVAAAVWPLPDGPGAVGGVVVPQACRSPASDTAPTPISPRIRARRLRPRTASRALAAGSRFIVHLSARGQPLARVAATQDTGSVIRDPLGDPCDIVRPPDRD